MRCDDPIVGRYGASIATIDRPTPRHDSQLMPLAGLCLIACLGAWPLRVWLSEPGSVQRAEPLPCEQGGARPLVVLVETNRWLMVIGSDVPRAGGIGALLRRAIPVAVLDLTAAKLLGRGVRRVATLFTGKAGAVQDPRGFEAFYPGLARPRTTSWFALARFCLQAAS